MKIKTKEKKKGIGRLLLKAVVIFFLLILLVIALLDIFSVAVLSLGYYFNWSSSMPIGLYKVSAPTDLKHGGVVVVCLPEAVGSVGLKRGYLNPGRCPGGYSPIIKELIATPGDSVTLTLQAIVVNGQNYIAPLQTQDTEGRPLESIPRGLNSQTPDYWLYGKGNPSDSWDSRYWGGVDRSSIIKKAAPVLTY